MKQGNAVLNISVVAAVALSAGQLVTLDGNIASATTEAHGVVLTDAKAGDLVAVTVLGTAAVQAAEAVSAGQPLKVAANGTVAVASGADKVVAIATEDAGEHQSVIVLLKG